LRKRVDGEAQNGAAKAVALPSANLLNAGVARKTFLAE